MGHFTGSGAGAFFGALGAAFFAGGRVPPVCAKPAPAVSAASISNNLIYLYRRRAVRLLDYNACGMRSTSRVEWKKWPTISLSLEVVPAATPQPFAPAST